MKLSLPAFALKRPVTTIMISISMLSVGAIAWFRMPLQFLPRVDRPVIGCMIPYPGASPEQVEQQIAIPVEGAFRTIPGLRRIRTTSNSDGCSVFMLFSLDTDMTLATAEVRDRIERLKLVLPPEADRMILQRFSSGSIPIVAFGVFSEEDPEEFNHQVRTIFEPRLRRLDGVADVQIHTPIQPKEVLVEFDQHTLRSMNLALAQVIAALRAGSLNLSVGQLEEGEQKYFVRVVGEYRRLEDVENLIVSPNGLRLKDVATVRFSSRSDVVHVALDGAGGVVLLVIKESEANTVATCQAVNDEINRILAMPEFKHTAIKLFFDQSDLIMRALRNLLMQGLYGGACAIIILFCFLHRLRPTIIVSLAIPTALVVALVFMFFAGMHLNVITMVSLIISVGMLVDNAIVVVENIVRHRQDGMSGRESAIKGATEVGLAIFGATVTTCVVFLPMYYLEMGRMFVFMQQLGFPLIVALFGSLVIALTLVPLVMSRMKEPTQTNLFKRLEARIVGKSSGIAILSRRVLGALGGIQLISRMIDAYSRLLRLVLTWRIAALCGMVLLAWITYSVPMQHVGMRELPKLDTREVSIDIRLEQNFDIAMARELFSQQEKKIETVREELGIKNVLVFHEARGGVIQVYLYTEDDGPIGRNPPCTTEEAMIRLSELLGKRLPGAELFYSIADVGDSGAARGVSIRMRGENARILRELAERFRSVMNEIPMLYDVETDIEHNTEEMQLRIDAPKAEAAGITPLIIATTVDAALRGARLPYMKHGGREVAVWAQFREEDRKRRSNLDNVTVAGATGALVPLNQLVEFNREYSPASIRRVNAKNVVNITAKTMTEDLSRIHRDLRAAVNAFYMPPGYTIEFGEELDELEDTIFNFTTTMLMAIILIFLVMSALFESWFLPLSILTTVPMALGGAVWMLYFTGSQLDMVTFIGCILMAGVIVNNGIVIVDHINNLRRNIPDRTEAIILGGCNRFRPVMMTALTTILGLVPLAMARTGGAGSFSGIGRALIGGLSAGTILTLLVVPLFYTILDDFQMWCADFFGSLNAMRRRTPPPRV